MNEKSTRRKGGIVWKLRRFYELLLCLNLVVAASITYAAVR